MLPANVPAKPAASPATKRPARSTRKYSCLASWLERRRSRCTIAQSASASASLDENPVQQAAEDEPLENVVCELAFAFERFRRQPQVIGEAEDLVQDADVIPRHVLGLARADHGRFVPVIDGSHDAALQRPLDVAEQDDAHLIGLVLGPVNEGLVENDRLA